MWDLSPLGAGGSSQSGLWSGTTYRHAVHRIWQKVLPFRPRELFGCQVGELAAVGCSSMGKVLCGNMSGGNRGVCPSRMWYEAASALLSDGGLLYKMT